MILVQDFSADDTVESLIRRTNKSAREERDLSENLCVYIVVMYLLLKNVKTFTLKMRYDHYLYKDQYAEPITLICIHSDTQQKIRKINFKCNSVNNNISLFSLLCSKGFYETSTNRSS